MFYRIIGGTLIQVSDRQLNDFREIIEDDKPNFDEATEYLAYNYEIINNEVHKTYRVEKIVIDENMEV